MSIEEIRKLAEQVFPYDPYRETLFPGQRSSFIEGFIKGYIRAQKDLENSKK